MEYLRVAEHKPKTIQDSKSNQEKRIFTAPQMKGL